VSEKCDGVCAHCATISTCDNTEKMVDAMSRGEFIYKKVLSARLFRIMLVNIKMLNERITDLEHELDSNAHG
jgi:hypothetical protein